MRIYYNNECIDITIYGVFEVVDNKIKFYKSPDNSPWVFTFKNYFEAYLMFQYIYAWDAGHFTAKALCLDKELEREEVKKQIEEMKKGNL